MVFNSEKTIVDAIKTIINQSFQNWGLIISNNNSNDSTVKII
jgi:glycosyltransferase involved in cell wall biosynthesis